MRKETTSTCLQQYQNLRPPKNLTVPAQTFRVEAAASPDAPAPTTTTFCGRLSPSPCSPSPKPRGCSVSRSCRFSTT
eukprot:1161969-Pelagomonas_calceolata.AAC.3